MSRDLKFKAWDKVLGKWVDPAMVYLTGDGTLRGWGDVPLDVSRFVLCFYTGLKDKNGVEIYEGDVVVGQVVVIGLLVKGIVVFKNGSFQLMTTISTEPIWLESIEPREVIANIHENPELLKAAA